MAKEKKTRRVDLVYPYSHGVILRRSGVSKKAWDYICWKFGITIAEPEQITSIQIEGEDDFGRLLISVNIEK